VATVADGRHTRRSSSSGQRRPTWSELDSAGRRGVVQGRRLAGNEAVGGWNSYGRCEATDIDVLRVREENGEATVGTARQARQAGGGSLTGEKGEAVLAWRMARSGGNSSGDEVASEDRWVALRLLLT
jgi:hypothetical protein